MKRQLKFLVITLILTIFAGSVQAADWSSTELQFQYGRLDNPTFAGGGSTDTQIYTIQHASGWKYGDNFFFVDFSMPENGGVDAYGELYSNFSLTKITGKDLSFGPVKDIGLLAGFNIGSDSNVKIYLPGIRFSWDIPGFAFLNSDFTAYIVDNPGAASGGAPDEDNSFMVDINWAYPITTGFAKFSIEGHVEYVGERENEFNQDVDAWILAQPQFRLDVGDLFGRPDTFFAGIEYQWWMNKLGDKNTDENTVQALLVWRL